MVACSDSAWIDTKMFRTFDYILIHDEAKPNLLRLLKTFNIG